MALIQFRGVTALSEVQTSNGSFRGSDLFPTESFYPIRILFSKKEMPFRKGKESETLPGPPKRVVPPVNWISANNFNENEDCESKYYQLGCHSEQTSARKTIDIFQR